MNFTTKMTQKGQVTIPGRIRSRLHVGRDSEFLVSFDERTREVRLTPLVAIEDLAGSLNSKVKLSDEELNQARARAWSERWM